MGTPGFGLINHSLLLLIANLFFNPLHNRPIQTREQCLCHLLKHSQHFHLLGKLKKHTLVYVAIIWLTNYDKCSLKALGSRCSASCLASSSASYSSPSPVLSSLHISLLFCSVSILHPASGLLRPVYSSISKWQK